MSDFYFPLLNNAISIPPFSPTSSSLNSDSIPQAISTLSVSGENLRQWQNESEGSRIHEATIQINEINLNTGNEIHKEDALWLTFDEEQLKEWLDNFLSTAASDKTYWLQYLTILSDLLEVAQEERHIDILRCCYYSMMRMYVVQELSLEMINNNRELFLKIYCVLGPCFSFGTTKENFSKANLSFLFEMENISFEELFKNREHSQDTNVQRCLSLLHSTKNTSSANDLTDSIKQLTFILHIYPDNLWILYQRSVLTDRLGMIKETHRDLNLLEIPLSRALAINPCLTFALTLRGVVRHKQDRLQESLNDFDKALQFEPTCAIALCEKFSLLKILTPEFDEKEFLKSVYKLDSKNPRILTAFAEFLSTTSLPLALKNINQVIEHNPNYIKAYSTRAIIYIKMDEYEKAHLDIDRAIAMLPSCDALKLVRLDILNRKNKRQEMVEAKRELLHDWTNKAITYLELLDKSKALKYCNFVLKADPQNAYVLQIREQVLKLA